MKSINVKVTDINCAVFTVFTVSAVIFFSFSPILQDSKRGSRVRVLDRKKKGNMQSQASYYLHYILSVIKDEMQLEKQTNK